VELTFDDFKDRAKDPNLSKWEKIGFPDSYRKESEKFIFDDVVEKLKLNDTKAQNILDIGCGCSTFVELIINFSNNQSKSLVLIDSEEMLANIDAGAKLRSQNLTLIPGCFPDIELNDEILSNKFDAILVYSVIQYPFLEGSIYSFIHKCVDLLNEGGRLLLGDIPNFSKRERFLASKSGQEFLDQNEVISHNILTDHRQSERIDDSIIFSILQRYRSFGCETYLLEQAPELPFSNRREDILIVKR